MSSTIGNLLIGVGVLVAALGIVAGFLLLGQESTQGVVKVSNLCFRAAEGIGFGSVAAGLGTILKRTK